MRVVSGYPDYSDDAALGFLVAVVLRQSNARVRGVSG